jgi:hypothetical protein
MKYSLLLRILTIESRHRGAMSLTLQFESNFLCSKPILAEQNHSGTWLRIVCVTVQNPNPKQRTSSTTQPCQNLSSAENPNVTQFPSPTYWRRVLTLKTLDAQSDKSNSTTSLPGVERRRNTYLVQRMHGLQIGIPEGLKSGRTRAVRRCRCFPHSSATQTSGLLLKRSQKGTRVVHTTLRAAAHLGLAQSKPPVCKCKHKCCHNTV